MKNTPAPQTLVFDEPMNLPLQIAIAFLLLVVGTVFWHLAGWSNWDSFVRSFTESENSESGKAVLGVIGLVCFVTGCALPRNKRRMIDLAGRQVIVVSSYAWIEVNKRTRPLSDFSHIVVRHLCHSDGEGAGSYTGGVGFKPVDGKAVLWVKNFPTTEEEVPRAAYAFAKQLQEMTGLPVTPMDEFKNEAH